MSELSTASEPTPLLRRRPLFLASAIVCIASAAAGGCFGLLSAMPYGMTISEDDHLWFDPALELLGGSSGAGFGLLAGMFWSLRMWQRTTRIVRAGTSLGSLIGWGALLGVICGLGCSIVVHRALMILSDTSEFTITLYYGVPFGLGVGVVVGLVCGTAWYYAARSAMKACPATEAP